MFDKILPFKSSQKPESPIDPMKEMVTEIKQLIHGEIVENPSIHQEQDYSLIIKCTGSTGATQFKSIGKSELEEIWKKIENWDKHPPGTAQGLAPREIEVLSEIEKAIEKGDLVVKQGEKLFTSSQQSAIYNEVLQQGQTIMKAEGLGQRKLLGRGEDGKVEIGQGGVLYDVMAGGSMQEVFGKEALYDESEYTPINREKLSAEEMKQEYLSEDFEKKAAVFRRDIRNLTPNEKETPEESAEQTHLFSTGKPQQTRERSDLHMQQSRQTLEKMRDIRLKNFGAQEKELDREAVDRRKQEKQLRTELDSKYERIKKETKAYDDKKKRVKDRSTGHT